MARVDRAQLEQVVMNLVVNAADAMPGGGAIVVSLDRVELDAPGPLPGDDELPAGAWARLSVEDGGQGMDPRTVERIFEPFFTTKGERGTGLGLATVYGIVKQSGGHIEVRTRVGEGTMIAVYLPLSNEEAREATGEHAVVRDGGGETILLVEDDPLVRASASRILRRFGYRIFEAENATEALETAERGEPFDLLLTDVVMPGGNGPQLAEALRRRRPDLPVVLMSGHIAPDEEGEPPTLGADARVAKPFTANTLLRAVRRALGRDPTTSAPA